LIIGSIIILLPGFVLFTTLSYSLENLSKSNIDNDMNNYVSVVLAESDEQFDRMQQFADLLIRRNVFLTSFNQKDTSALQTLIEYEMRAADMDFAMVVDTDQTVLVRDSTSVSGDSAPFPTIVEDALQGKSISSTETVSLKDLGREKPDLVMVQVYLTPIYENESAAGVFITGRILNNISRIPDDIERGFINTTTTVYQEGSCIATSSKPGNDALLGTVLPPDTVEGLSRGKVHTGEIQRFSTLHVFGAVPLTNYDNEVIGTILISSSKEPYTAAIENFNQTIHIAIFAAMVFAIFIIIVNVKEITTPLINLKEAVRFVADGKGYKKIELVSKDEVGELAVSFNEMMDALEQRDQKINRSTEELIRTNKELEEYSAILQEHKDQLEAHQQEMNAYTDFLTILSSTIDIKTVLSEGLSRLMDYTNSPVGAVYLYNSENKMLEPNITQGAQEIVSEQQFALGEGIPGQTAVNKEMTIIRDISEDTIFRMEAGVCEVLPETVVSTPMIFNDELLGVVVMCHLGEVPRNMQEFIQHTIDQLAVSVNNANSFIRVQEMAYQLKNQRDELEIQSHELEAASKNIEDTSLSSERNIS